MASITDITEELTIGSARNLLSRARSVIEIINMAAEAGTVTGDAGNAIAWTCIHAQDLLDQVETIITAVSEGGEA
jgi:hypothetical protein